MTSDFIFIKLYTKTSTGDYLREIEKSGKTIPAKNVIFNISKYSVITFWCHHTEYFFSESFLVCILSHNCHVC